MTDVMLLIDHSTSHRFALSRFCEERRPQRILAEYFTATMLRISTMLEIMFLSQYVIQKAKLLNIAPNISSVQMEGKLWGPKSGFRWTVLRACATSSPFISNAISRSTGMSVSSRAISLMEVVKRYSKAVRLFQWDQHGARTAKNG